MIGYVIIFSFLIGFILAAYGVLKCMPFILDHLASVSRTNERAAKAEGQNELYRDFVAALGTQNSGFVYAAIEVVKDANKQAHPLPYQLGTGQNGTHTHTHAPTHEHTHQNSDKKGDFDSFKLVLRKGVRELGTFSFNVQRIKFVDKNEAIFTIPLPQKGDKIAKFEGVNLYAGYCKNCSNRFVSKDVKAEYCQDTCKDNYHSANKY